MKYKALPLSDLIMCEFRASDKDVRDKQTLADNRATIERRMERFKECEKDMKVKDFSKVGLEKGNKLDPKQVAIEERREWIRTCVEQISNTVSYIHQCQYIHGAARSL